ncbi:MAG: 50S ribosomal protein L10 [Candidatus Taylorbacteria bacterium]
MPISKEKKKEIYAKLAELARENKGVAFVNFHTMTVKDISEARRVLKSKNVGYYVAKKTLVKRALTDAKIEGEMPELLGEVGVAYSVEPTAPAREVFEFAKKFENKFSLLGGVFEGVFKNKEEIRAIALIPSLQALRGMFVNLINSPRQRFAMVLSEKAKKS